MILATALATGCHRPTSSKKADESYISPTGPEWLGWTQTEKQKYVIGYLDGSALAISEHCSQARASATWPGRKEPLTEEEQFCTSPARSYSHGKTDYLPTYTDPYVKVMDDFYRHPECRSIPFSTLLEHLNDAEFTDGDSLFRKVHIEGVRWGGFTIPGIEDCFPQHPQ
ncbi:hypothetical protein SAMN05421819_0412 [Bryocella elongata]|uniref:Uncharacterized protein n=2 Tax=Bryocella elongata TaxID=863522 RepID=A0A1H5SZD5_9BACT|nr:hypothetical protein SAMN05421819_0412 [Bryocella elongata]